MKNIHRRTFLEFLGIGTAAVFAPGCISSTAVRQGSNGISLRPIPPSAADEVRLAEGLRYEVLVKWGDPISATENFGFNNDYTAFLPSANNPGEGLLWVNHEYVDPMYVSGFLPKKNASKTKEHVDREMLEVGGSIVRLRRAGGRWQMVPGDPLNRRITGLTEIPFNWPEPIAGRRTAIGTLGNCSGGVTPWGTILTCEENYDLFYGERDHETGGLKTSDGDYAWHRFHANPPEHYGWVVEVDPLTGGAQKHVALGRCAHECATVAELPDGRVVVYTADDANDECLYKFISAKPGSLSEGTLYVANLAQGRWLPLVFASQKVLQEKFSGQTEVLVRLREASKLVGGTELHRPEDIEINPVNGDVLVTLTNNLPKKNYHGSILKIMEKEGRHDALEFTHSTLLAGGEATGFACPDNMAFDPRGNLWFTTDVSGSSMNRPDKPEYLPFKNNSLFVVPINGGQAGQPIRVATAPVNAEFTGPFFSPDGKTLFLSVQHPGEYSPSPAEAVSHWPEGGNAMPRPAVIAIYGLG